MLSFFKKKTYFKNASELCQLVFCRPKQFLFHLYERQQTHLISHAYKVVCAIEDNNKKCNANITASVCHGDFRHWTTHTAREFKQYSNFRRHWNNPANKHQKLMMYLPPGSPYSFLFQRSSGTFWKLPLVFCLFRSSLLINWHLWSLFWQYASRLRTYLRHKWCSSC